MSDAGRLFTEQELAVILKRAAELQEGVGSPAARGELTLAEIQSLASHAGIDPAFIAQAASTVGRAAPRVFDFLGGPARFQYSGIISGELTTPEMHEVMELLQHQTALQRKLTDVRNAIEWRARDTWGNTVVLITPRDGSSRIRMLLTRSDVRGVIYGLAAVLGVLASFGVAAAAIDSPALVVGGVAATMATSFLAARAVWRRTARSLEQAGRRTFDSLVEAAREITSHKPARIDE